jgi:hypothetical protein
MQQRLVFIFTYSNNIKELLRNKLCVIELKITGPIVFFTAH